MCKRWNNFCEWKLLAWAHFTAVYSLYWLNVVEQTPHISFCLPELFYMSSWKHYLIHLWGCLIVIIYRSNLILSPPDEWHIVSALCHISTMWIHIFMCFKYQCYISLLWGSPAKNVCMTPSHTCPPTPTGLKRFKMSNCRICHISCPIISLCFLR